MVSSPATESYSDVEPLADGRVTSTYRGKRTSDGLHVILKVLKESQATRETLGRFHNEYEAFRSIRAKRSVRALAFAQVMNRPAMVMEDFGGISLDRIRRTSRPNIQESVRIAIKISEALAELHQANFVHCDVNPGNVIYNAKSGELKLCDFGLARYTAGGGPVSNACSAEQCTFAYMSPEQTRRISCPVDYRSDFYSLGATLYELVTGQTPFEARSAIEWFHCHVAKQPASPRALNAEISNALSDLILKLLAKSADDRYQSADGIKFDLEACLALQESEGQQPFALGQRDVPANLQFRQQLYGRTLEEKQLEEALQACFEGGSSLTTVTGEVGTGKTALVERLRPTIAAAGGYFGCGRGEQTQRDIPFSALAGALRDLLRQLLTREPSVLVNWKDSILSAVGERAQLLNEFFPEASLILGAHPPAATLPPVESQKRFVSTLLDFIGVFGLRGHPVTIFLDDAQWADNDSLSFLEKLISSSSGAVMVICARGGDRSGFEPMHERLLARAIPWTHISLGALDLTAVSKLLIDTLRTTPEKAEILSQCVVEKTGANPFFIKEFLHKIHREGLLSFQPESGEYEWNIEKLADQHITDNMAELMLQKLAALQETTLSMLKVAACIGTKFHPGVLAHAAAQSRRSVTLTLHEAVTAGLIVPVRENFDIPGFRTSDDSKPELNFAYVFAHERIQQTAYELLELTERRHIHGAIGQYLQENLTDEAREEQLFLIARHLNEGEDSSPERASRDRLCAINVACGKKASRAGAHDAAFRHFLRALGALDPSAWNRDRSTAFELHVRAAEAAYLTQHYDELRSILQAGLARCETLLEKVSLHEVEILASIAQGKMGQAVDIAKPVLASLGMHYPRKPGRVHLLVRIAKLRWQIWRRGGVQEVDLPRLNDPILIAAQRIGARVASAALFVDQTLSLLMGTDMASMSLTHGYTHETPASFQVVGMIFAGGMGDVERGMWFGLTGLEIAEKLGDPACRGRALHAYCALVQHWRDPLHDTLPGFTKSMQLSLESGGFEFAAHASMVRARYALLAGHELERLEKEVSSDMLLFRSLGHGQMLYHHASTRQVMQNLQGKSPEPHHLAGESYDIDKMLPKHREARDRALVQSVQLNQLFLSYLFGDTVAAADLVEQLERSASGGSGFYTSPWSMFLGSLVRIRVAEKLQGWRRFSTLRLVAQELRELKKLSRRNPSTYLHKWHLLKAESLRVAGRDMGAHADYDACIRLAKENDWLQEEALGNELCGQMHASAGRLTLAAPYIQKAFDLYRRWGANAKADDLQRRFPELIFHSNDRARDEKGLGRPEDLDLGALTQALTSIAAERVHSRMVASIIRISLELAGAQRGALILRNSHGELCIEAEADVEGEPKILQSQPLKDSNSVCLSVVNYVARTRSGVVIDDAQEIGDAIPGLHRDPYVAGLQVRSILCLPILAGGADGEESLVGLLYLENNRLPKCFTEGRHKVLEIICLSAAGRIELSRRAAVDGLTQLYNHEYFQNMLKQELAVAIRHKRDLSLLLCDIDHFKRFNDTWGHQIGDKVLKAVADSLKSNAREGDLVARYGGEEMVIILPSTSKAEALVVAERLRRKVEALKVGVSTGEIGVTASIGLCSLSTEVNDAASLIRNADAALYLAKAAGRNRVVASSTDGH